MGIRNARVECKTYPFFTDRGLCQDSKFRHLLFPAHTLLVRG